MSDERGMTLVELLVAISMGTIVIFVAATMMISSLRVTGQVTGRMTAVAQGRTGLETLLGQLNSGCLVNSASPILANTSSVDPSLSPAVSSDANDLVFTTGLNDSTNPTPTLHVVYVNSSGALVDYAYSYAPGPNSVLGTPSTWLFSSTPSQILNLAQHVTPGTNPSYFTYYAYSSSTNSLQGASAITPNATNASTIAEVDLDFRFAPTASGYSPTATSELQDSVVFSLTAQDAGTSNGPCQ